MAGGRRRVLALAFLAGCNRPGEVENRLDSSTGVADSTAATHADASDVMIDDVPSGIGIVGVTLNQGVGIELVEHGEVVADRAGAVIAGRAAAVLVSYELASDWHAREIVARLSVIHAGETTELADQRNVTVASGDDLAETFQFLVDAELVAADTELRIELAETDPRADVDGEVSSPAAIPAGDAGIGLEAVSGPNDLEIVIVPFDYDDGEGCVTSPDLDDEMLERFTDAIYQQLPVDDIHLSVHEPEPWTEPFDGWLRLNIHLSEIRSADGVGPQVIYYGLMDPCMSPFSIPVGMAYGVPADPTAMDAAFQRCAFGMWHADRNDVAQTFVHEVSHTLGRGHVTCNSEGFPVDPHYPIEGGDLDTWGFGVLDHVVRPQNVTKDFMTYCEPSWVSAYGWRLMQPVVHTLASWDAGNGGVAPGRLLIGAVTPRGASWRVVDGRMPEGLATDLVQVEAEVDGAPRQLAGWVSAVADEPGSTLVLAPLPDDAGRVDVASWRY